MPQEIERVHRAQVLDPVISNPLAVVLDPKRHPVIVGKHRLPLALTPHRHPLARADGEEHEANEHDESRRRRRQPRQTHHQRGQDVGHPVRQEVRRGRVHSTPLVDEGARDHARHEQKQERKGQTLDV